MFKTLKILLTLLGCMAAVVAIAGNRSDTIPPTDSVVLVLTFGFPISSHREAIRSKVAARYGFQYFSVGGCVVSEQTVCCVGLLNQVTEEYLAKRNGKDWQKRYYREIESLYNLHDSAVAIARSAPFIKKYLKQHKDITDEYWSYLVNIQDSGICDVDIHDGRDANGHKLLARFRVNTNNKKIKQLSTNSDICYEHHYGY